MLKSKNGIISRQDDESNSRKLRSENRERERRLVVGREIGTE